MPPEIRFTAFDQFELGGIKFALATAQTATTAERALIYKDRGFVDSYIETLVPLGAKRVFEFGIYQGGSALFIAALLDVEKFVCLDIADRVEAFESMLARHPLGRKIAAHWNVSQDATDQVREILEREFGDNRPDLIIDDASHLYDQTKKSFEIAFPYLADGGHYIIEDWSWSHWPENQAPSHGWFHLPAMSNLILELVMLLPSSDMIEHITVRQGYVVIKKKASRFQRHPLNIDGSLRTRGQHLNKI